LRRIERRWRPKKLRLPATELPIHIRATLFWPARHSQVFVVRSEGGRICYDIKGLSRLVKP